MQKIDTYWIPAIRYSLCTGYYCTTTCVVSCVLQIEYSVLLHAVIVDSTIHPLSPWPTAYPGKEVY